MENLSGKRQTLLLYRFSAMGDVALLVPVIRSLLASYSSLEVTLVTRPFFAPFFSFIDRCHVVPAHLKGEHKGLRGIYRLFRQLNEKGKWDFVADMHNVLRSWQLNLYWRLAGKIVARLDKERRAKKILLKQGGEEILSPLKHVTERYADTIRELGFEFKVNSELGIIKRGGKLLERKTKYPYKIGFSPVAQHPTKSLPEDFIISFLEYVEQQEKMEIFCFGGRADASRFDQWEARFACVTNLSGKGSLEEELQWIQQLDGMVAVDSSNMHLAALSSIPVLSLWGGTHPAAGFGVLSQPFENTIQIDRQTLPCRPCSIFGKKKCKRNDFACFYLLPIETIYLRLFTISKKRKQQK